MKNLKALKVLKVRAKRTPTVTRTPTASLVKTSFSAAQIKTNELLPIVSLKALLLYSFLFHLETADFSIISSLLQAFAVRSKFSIT